MYALCIPSNSVGLGLSANLVVLGFISAHGYLSSYEQGSIAHSLSVSPSHHPYMTKIQLKKV